MSESKTIPVNSPLDDTLEDTTNSDLVRQLIYAECRRLSFSARKWAKQNMAGAYKSLLRGSGIEFDSARVYSSGDDAKRIDWKITARKSTPYVKYFREDREHNVLLLIDVSKSTKVKEDFKAKNKIIEAVAYLCSIALHNKDKIGALLFEQDIVKSIKSSNRSSTIYNILFQSLESRNKQSESVTNLSSVLRTTNSYLKKSSIIFIISDFNFPVDYESALLSLQQKHSVYALWIDSTNIEGFLSENNTFSGLIRMNHPETGEELILDLGNKKSKKYFSDINQKHREGVSMLFKRTGTKHLYINEADAAGDSGISNSLIKFFARLSHKSNLV